MQYGIHGRTRIYDVLRGKGDWPTTHDGRAIINETLRDLENGVAENELHEKYDIAMKGRDYSRLAVFAGTGLGLITKQQTVAEILDQVEMQFADTVKSVNERLGRLS
jgi:nitronate monooxygenase